MRAIWKFPFEINDEVEIEMPGGARILHVDVQLVADGTQESFEVPAIWALVNPENEKRTYKFIVFGTGHPVPDRPIDAHITNDLHHIASFQMMAGRLVWHMFEKPDWMK